MPRRVYWDACTFIGLLNQEPGKVNDCRIVWKEAEKGHTLIYTSFFAFTEVIRTKCESGVTKPLPEEDDAKIQQFLRQPWIKPVVVDEKISFAARKLIRHHTECKKPSDGIHLSTALALNVDEMHTFDGSDLLKLNGKVLRADGKALTICKPRPSPPEEDPNQPDLYVPPSA